MNLSVVNLVIARSHLRLVTVIIHRVWPVLMSAYLTLVVASPSHLALYGFGPKWMSDVPLLLAALSLVLAAWRPFATWIVVASMAATTWALMGRAATFALDVDGAPWTRVLGTGVYTLLTVATVLIFFVHVVIDMEARMRGTAT